VVVGLAHHHLLQVHQLLTLVVAVGLRMVVHLVLPLVGLVDLEVVDLAAMGMAVECLLAVQAQQILAAAVAAMHLAAQA